jgi:hypothetical protein
MTTVNPFPESLQWLFTEEANRLGRASGFIEREREWTGARFAQALVFGWMQHPEASLSQLQQTAWMCGCEVSVKNVTTRLSEPEASVFVSGLLESALQMTVAGAAHGSSVPLPFAQVILLDSTQVSLPLPLEAVWPGGGNQHQARAGMKVQALYEWIQGHLHLSLHPRPSPVTTNSRCRRWQGGV